jgi:hypothetical protein
MKPFSPFHSWNEISGVTDLYGEKRVKTQRFKVVKLEQATKEEANELYRCECLIHAPKAALKTIEPGIARDLKTHDAGR